MLGLCLVVAFAVGALASTSASALPEWGQCFVQAKHEGKYTDSNCTKKAKKVSEKFTGEFEFRTAKQVSEKRVAEGKSAGVPFTGKNVGTAILTSGGRTCEVAGAEPAFKQLTRKACAEKGGKEKQEVTEPLSVECAAESDSGEASPTNKVINVHITFTGCLLGGSVACNTKGKKAGEITTTTLKGNLGYIKKAAPKEVGLLLEAAKKKAAVASFECGEPPFFSFVEGVGSEAQGAEFATSGCFGPSCPGTTPAEEKFGGYDGIIAPITPFNKMTNTYTQVYTREASEPWRNIPNKFEGKHIDVLEGYFANSTGELSDWSSAGQVVTLTNTSEETDEITA